MDQDSGTRDVPTLSGRLFSPTSLLGMVLLGLTTLPMARCDSNGSEIVPVRVALSLAGFEQSVPPPLSERITGFVGSIPILFMITAPYWTAVPATVPIVVLPFSRRWGTRLWRLLVLMLALALTSLMFAGEPPWGPVIGFGGLAALGVWIWSSPSLAWLWHIVVRRKRPAADRVRRAKRSIAGGFWASLLLCFTAMGMLSLNSDLLIGGKLAAFTNAAMAVIAGVSARQAMTDCERVPRFSIQDLLVTMIVFAISLARFLL